MQPANQRGGFHPPYGFVCIHERPLNTPGGICSLAYRHDVTSAVIASYLTCSIPGAPQVRRFFSCALISVPHAL
ncbi:hypothetical protein N619_29475 [Ectopseudomonas oleovorans]|nr:hypothetical protein N619_29475 [Pseudomonas oleovorans]